MWALAPEMCFLPFPVPLQPCRNKPPQNRPGSKSQQPTTARALPARQAPGQPAEPEVAMMAAEVAPTSSAARPEPKVEACSSDAPGLAAAYTSVAVLWSEAAQPPSAA